MKTIGLVGGLGPEATVDYYNGIIDAFKTGDLNYPEIIIYSVNMSVFIGLMKEKRFDEAAQEVVKKIISLERAGAEFAAITANTPHMLFEQISAISPIPLISIVEATLDECLRKGYSRPGLLGTGFTMRSSFYQDVFMCRGLDVIMPEKNDINEVDFRIFSEIELGIFKEETRQMLIGVTGKMARDQKIDSMILGCTELPLILRETSYNGIPMLNTTKIHVDAIVKYSKGAVI